MGPAVPEPPRLNVPFRDGTVDRAVYDAVVHLNEYELPERFVGSDAVLDVGAHIGAFTLAVLARGAGHVLAIEADPENHAIAARNLGEAVTAGRASLLQGAAWRSDPNEDVLRLSGHPTIGTDIVNTGGARVSTAPGGTVVPKVAFDELVARVAAAGAGRVRLVKLDCEGSEWPILRTARRLEAVEAIVGEYHEDAAHDAAHLHELLRARGFRVRSHPHRDASGREQPLGLFFATRPPRESP